MNKRILASMFSIATVAAMMASATYAVWTDAATSSDNVFASGSLNLQLDDADQTTPVESVSASIGGSGMIPGGPAVTGFISVHNGGTISISEVLFGANQTSGGGGPFNLADVLGVTVKTDPSDSTCATGTDQTGAIATQLGDGFSPLTMTELVTADYDSLPSLAASGTYYVCLSASLPSTVGNDYQGLSATFDFVFTGNQ